MVSEFLIPYATPSLNETLKESDAAKAKRRKLYEQYIWVAQQKKHPGPVRLEIIRHCSGTLDDDNFTGGCKTLQDALVNMKIIVDDNPAIIVQPVYEQVKISRTLKPFTIVKVISL